MKWKFCVPVSLLSFCCLASVVSWTSAARTTGATPVERTTAVETLPAESTTVIAGILDSGTWKYPKLGYVEKSKVNELITRMNQTVQILNRKDTYLNCNEKGDKIEAAVVDADNIKMCDDNRILRIQKDLSEVAAGLFQLAIRLSEPSEEDVFSLDRKKFQLIYDLKALRVFYGPSPCNDNSIALYPFQPLVEYVEWNLDQVFVLFQTTRPTRPTPPTTTSTFPSTTPKPSEEGMLDPHASFVELTEMAQSNPKAMSRALPRIVSQRYNEKASTFDKLLNFTEGLPTTENRIFGVSAIHDEMYRYNRNPEFEKLMKVAKTVERLNRTASSSTVKETAVYKLTDLIRDPDLNPIIILQDPQTSYVELKEMALLNPAAMSIALPEIVSERYNASALSFEALLNFIEGLQPEYKIVGFAAVYDEILYYRRNQGELQMLAKTVKRLNETVVTSLNGTSSLQLKLADLVDNLSPLTFIGEKAECNVTNVAYQLQLSATDYGSPYSAYLDNSGYLCQVYPKVEDGRLVFRISRYGVQYQFYASDSNPNTNSYTVKYQTQPSERYLLFHFGGKLLTDTEVNWKLVPIEGKANQFKILSAKSDDFMFAHQSATGFAEWRRVLLGRKSHSSHAHIPEADNWTFECKPGNFTVPAK